MSEALVVAEAALVLAAQWPDTRRPRRCAQLSGAQSHQLEDWGCRHERIRNGPAIGERDAHDGPPLHHADQRRAVRRLRRIKLSQALELRLVSLRGHADDHGGEERLGTRGQREVVIVGSAGNARLDLGNQLTEAGIHGVLLGSNLRRIYPPLQSIVD